MDETLRVRLEAVVKRLETVEAQDIEYATPIVADPASGGDSTSGKPSSSPSVTAYDAILAGGLARYMTASKSIGGDVEEQALLTLSAFTAQREFVVKLSVCKEPPKPVAAEVLQPVVGSITSIQTFRESHHKSTHYNHLSAVSEAISALGWVSISPAPAPYVSEMLEAGKFYTNRVLKEAKEKPDGTQHIEWVKAWLETLTELQTYVKEYHTTGIQWQKRGRDVMLPPSCEGPPPLAAPCPPPPPPPPPPPAIVVEGQTVKSSDSDARSALFSELSKGEDVTRSLRKVTDDMKTHKNPALRRANKPAPNPKPAAFAAKPIPSPQPSPDLRLNRKAVAANTTSKATIVAQRVPVPRFELEGNKWFIEHQTGNRSLVVSETAMKQTVYIYKCVDCTVRVHGKVNAITLNGCKKTALVFDEVIASLDFINCASVQAQVIHRVPTVSIDKTDGCMIYLSDESLDAQIVTAKSSEMNVLVPDHGAPASDGAQEYKEFPIPEQFRTSWCNGKLVTATSELIG